MFARRKKRGAVAVEFALLLPIIALLLLGSIELTNMYRVYLTLAEASRDGVRIVARDGYDSAASPARVSQIVGVLSWKLPGAAPTSTVTFNAVNRQVTVGVSYVYHPIFSGSQILVRFLSEPVRLNAASTMVVP